MDSSSVGGADDSEDRSESESDISVMVVGYMVMMLLRRKLGEPARQEVWSTDATISAAITRVACLQEAMTYYDMIGAKILWDFSFNLSKPPYMPA